MKSVALLLTLGMSCAAIEDLPACPKGIFDGFCHPWELRDGGVACVRDTSPGAKITKPSDVQCVPKKNGGKDYNCPSWAPLMCQPVFDGKNIVELAVATPDLSTLVTALKAGKLTSALSGTGPFTVFAPTNEAFAKLPKATLDHLLDPKNIKELDALLEYHVISGAAVYKADLMADQEVKTLEGQDVEVKKTSSGEVFVNMAQVVTADVDASNGVVHIINAVLMPPSPAPAAKNIVELAAATPDLSTLVTALKAGKLVDALSGAGPFTVFAPTNEAFAKLPKATLDHLLDPKNIAELDKILEYHVISGSAVHKADLKPEQSVATLEGGDVHIVKSGGGDVFVNQAQVVTADVDASNGVVHIINAVLMPPDATSLAVMV